MGAGKNKNHRKKRISKHVLSAQDRKKQTDVEEKLLSAAERKGGEGAAAEESGESKAPEPPSPSAPASKIKDPREGSSYLSLWKRHRAGDEDAPWKFNKNTQSWLYRHMYDHEKVSKATFSSLVEYLCSGKEGFVRSRVEEEAKRRARRYKEWEKGRVEEEKEEEQETVAKDAESKGKKGVQSSDDAPWNELDEHDKRKEYKRARKVLDAIKAVREEIKSEPE